MNVPDFAEMSLKQFCGEKGFNPIDDRVQNREIDPRRYFGKKLILMERILGKKF